MTLNEGHLVGVVTRIALIRSTASLRLALVSVGILFGLSLALFHWVGFILAGFTIGLFAASVKEAMVAALFVWIVVLITFLGYATWYGQLDRVFSLGELTFLALILPLALIFLGAAVRTVT